MKVRSFIHLWAIATLLLASCSVNDLLNPDKWLGDRPISFSTRLPVTRAAAFEESGVNAYKTMGVYAIISDGFMSYDLMVNQKVERVDGNNGWHYSPSTAWPDNRNTVSFYAYAPHNIVTPTQEYEGAIPTIQNFTIAATANGKAENQIDLLIAESVTDTRDTSTTAVKLTMRHVLTRVLFSARTQHPYANNVTSIQINRVEITGLKNQGTHILDALNSWTAQGLNSSVDNSYTLTSAEGGLRNINISNTALTEINAAEGNLYLMPQVITDNSAKLHITVNTVGGTNNGEKIYSFDLIDLIDELKQGEALRFLLTVPNAANPEQFQIKVIHGDWNAEYNIDADIERDPVLYISNETVHAYDGSVACIYFSSNIPPNADGSYNDIIYIEDKGRIGSNIGAAFNVEEEFYAIAQNDKDRNNIKLDYSLNHINNLRYEKDASGLYKGHLDIVQRKTSTAGETPNQGKQLLILKLHVGKLVRDITVQRVVTTEAAKQNPTRYVGTFHRHHETGERIVTWHEDEDTRWRVEKDVLGENDDIAELQLDTRISPDFRNNQLYSLVARDPEGTRVEQNNNLFGRGRVYFRVGWKTPTNGITNRYARVKVSLWRRSNPIDGPATETHYLYCRQGETEEKIATADSRYSVYNVSTPNEFVRYPSQTGMLYQWNRTNPWSPLGENPPYGWNKDPNDYETEFSYERSVCPDGYVYPSTTQKTEMEAVFGSTGAATPSARGYYADGYFDRRAVTYTGATSIAKNEHRVNASNIEVAAIGTILFNHGGLGYPDGIARSIFLVSGGYRNVDPFFGPDGGLVANDAHGDNHGVHGGYWFDLQGASAPYAKGASIFKGTTAAYIKDYPKRNAHSVRCIRATGWLVVFNANGGENAPRNMTIPNTETTIDIPDIKPDTYYRDDFEFDGWKKSGSSTLYTAGQKGINLFIEFGAAALPVKRVELIAQWKKIAPFADIVDFRTLGVPTNYLFDITTNSTDPYATYTIGSNGTAYQSADSEAKARAYFNGADKAYPILEFSEMYPEANFATAYNACKDMAPIGTWRLPRAQEVVLIQLYSTRANELLGDPGNGTWTGTGSTAGAYLFSFRKYFGFYTDSTNDNKTYRCVRPAAP